MYINGVMINASCEDIVSELRTQLAINHIPYLQKVRDSGRNIQVQCPYHGNGQERKPSAGILKEDGTFNCFACHEVHTLPEVISYCFGYTDDMLGKEGFKWILKNFATVRVEERKDVPIDVVRNKGNTKHNRLDNTSDNQSVYITEEELDKYRYYHKYWRKRGITDELIIELFDLGYDKETDCITFPVRNVMGNCLFVARRSVKTKWFNYPAGAEKPLYGLYEICSCVTAKKVDTVYVTESMIDCLRLWQNKKYAVALNGTGSESQFEELRKLPCRHLILATDNDKAGLYARDRIKKAVRNKIITQVVIPEGKKDIGDCTDEEIRNLEEVW
jgi:DNA primase